MPLCFRSGQTCSLEENVLLGGNLSLAQEEYEGEQAVAHTGFEKGAQELLSAVGMCSFALDVQEIQRSELTQLTTFLAHVCDLLGVLTPETQDLARQQLDCCRQLNLLVRLIEQQERGEAPDRVGNCSGAISRGNNTLKARELGSSEWAKKLDAARRETCSLRHGLETCIAELSQMKKAMDVLSAEQVEAHNCAMKDLRTELEMDYNHQQARLEHELEVKSSEISLLRAAQISSSVVETSVDDEYITVHNQPFGCVVNNVEDVPPAEMLLTSLGIAERQLSALRSFVEVYVDDIDVVTSHALQEFVF